MRKKALSCLPAEDAWTKSDDYVGSAAPWWVLCKKFVMFGSVKGRGRKHSDALRCV
jgi:hypothetical protein